METAVKMSYMTTADVRRLGMTMTISEVVEAAIDVLSRMPQPVRWVAGPFTSGRRTSAENRTRLHRTILRYKEAGATTFNYLPFQRRAMQLLRRESWRVLPFLKVPEEKIQERLRDELYIPIFRSGYIATLYVMPGSNASLHVQWMMGFAAAKGIPIRLIPEELVPRK